MSNQNAGYTVQPPAVAFAANLGSLTSNMRFYQQRGIKIDVWIENDPESIVRGM